VASVGWAWLAAVTLLALGLRCGLVAQEYHDQHGIHPGGGDESEYLLLSENLGQHGYYVDGSPSQRHVGLHRPPGYPVFCALLSGGRSDGTFHILWAQTLTAGLIPPMLMLLLGRLGVGRILSIAAGLASALSVTGIGLAGFVLADSLFATLFLMGFLCLFLSFSNDHPRMAYGAAAAFAVAALVKPVTLFWPLASPLVWLLLAVGLRKPLAWRRLGLFVLIQVAIMGSRCIRNQATEKTLSFTTIDAQNLRDYLAPLVQQLAKSHGWPSRNHLKNARRESGYRDWGDLNDARISPAELAARERRESWKIFSANPSAFRRAVWSDMVQAVNDTYALTDTELPEPSAMHRLMDVLEAIACSGWLLLASLVLAACSVILPLAWRRTWQSPDHRLRFFTALALIGTFVFLDVMASTTYGTGSRIMYPVQFALIGAVILGLKALIETIARLIRVHV
jgi:hypothetical protein